MQGLIISSGFVSENNLCSLMQYEETQASVSGYEP